MELEDGAGGPPPPAPAPPAPGPKAVRRSRRAAAAKRVNHAQRDRELEAALRDAEREGDRARAARRGAPKAGAPSAADMSQALAALAKAEEQLAARTRQLDRVTARNALLEQELLELRKRPAADPVDGVPPQAKKRKEGEEAAAAAAPAAPEDQRDWAGLPTEVLLDVARRLQRSTHARYAARKRKLGERVNGPRDPGVADDPSLGVHGLFAFAMVCKGWRAAQVQVGKLKTRATCVLDHHHLPLLLWALRQGLPTVPPDVYSGYYRRRTTAKTNLCDLAAFVGFAGGLRYLHAATGTHALKSMKVTKNTTTHALRGGCVEVSRTCCCASLVARKRTDARVQVLEFLDSPSMKWSTPVSGTCCWWHIPGGEED